MLACRNYMQLFRIGLFFEINSWHVHYPDPQSRLAPRHPVARRLPPGRQGQDPHPGEPVQVAAEAIELLRLYLKGHQLVPAAEAFDVIASLHHGHVEAVLLTMRRLGFASLLASRSSRARELVLALVAARILEPESKLATTRSWHVTSLPTTLGVADADADELYAAMDWLLQRQDRIEQKLAARHLHNDGLALYDPELQLSSRASAVPWLHGATIETARKASCRSITAF